ncbi:MAG: ATP phosphoribosyltransferase regulatory subunit, partial [Coprobacillus sp.]|nr:ATP phosphoribosyltransferase regulatory subunit [Coprobacillus sp.]
MEEVKYLIPEESIDAIMNNVSVLREIENDLRDIFTKN